MRMQGMRPKRFQVGGFNPAPAPTPQQLAAMRAQQDVWMNQPASGVMGPSQLAQMAQANALSRAANPGVLPGGLNPFGGLGQPVPTGAGGAMGMPPAGGAGTSAFSGGAPGNALGAAPGLNPAAIQQALMMRRGMAGGPPAQGGPAGAPMTAWPALRGMPGGMPPGLAATQGIPPGLMGGFPPPAPVGMGALPGGIPPGLAGTQGISPGLAAGFPPPALAGMGAPGALPPPSSGLGAPLAAAPPLGAPLGGVAGMGRPFARGGAVDEDAGEKKPLKRKFGGAAKAAEDIPVPAKKARGGVLKRRPPKPPAAPKAPRAPKAPTPTPSPYDMDQTAALSPAAGPGPGLPPGLAGPPGPPGMAKGGKWIQGAIKKPGALHAQLGVPQGEKIPAKKLAKAAQAGGKLGQRARLAQTLKGFKKAKGGMCEDCGKVHSGSCKMAGGGKVSKFDSTADLQGKNERPAKYAAGGAAKQRKHFPNTIPPPKKMAKGGTVRGYGIAERGRNFSGIY